MPKVSVCIPTYNRAKMLPYAVESVLSQTYPDFELIICDDGSKDNTPQLVNGWSDSRIRYVRHSANIGRSKNMRSGFQAACGDYFIKFDDDDALTPQFLEKTVAILETYPTVDFICTDHWVINAKNERDEAATQANSAKWGKDRLEAGIISDLLTETFRHQSLQVGSTLFRRACLNEVDFMRAEADGCEDFDLLVRLAIAHKQGYFLPEFLMEYRMHGGQTSLKQDIHFLSAKLFCLNSYKFDNLELEQFRLNSINHLRRVLALRLIEKGDSQQGRKLLQEAQQSSGSSLRSAVGLVLSYLPIGLRQLVFQTFRQIRTKDYSERVREVSG
jgi:glycosyltransferase involved in cell wall biosynthesis